MPMKGIRACVFDAYGTLFDYRSAAMRCRDLLGDDLEELNALWREKQLQYTWLRSIQGRYVDFRQVTADALDFALETLRITRPAVRDRLMELYLHLAAFPEVPAVLQRLRAAGFGTAILSNGTQAMLEAAAESSGIRGLLDHVLSVDAVGVYKPHARVYELAVERLGLPPQAIAFQSANAWDAYAASDFGMRVVWCNRYDQRPERLPGRPDFELKSLSGLPELFGA
jgi:2-haloacid dehalogenase